MQITETDYDAVVIGAGFYGCMIAVYLAKQRGLKRIAVIERATSLLTGASYHNQARVHNGYHYPRSFTTAYRSRMNLPKFVRDWPGAIRKDFTKLYAIARRNSKVTAKQFQRFCQEIGAYIETADLALKALFEPRLIEEVFLVQEYAFDATQLAHLIQEELNECDVQIHYETTATRVTHSPQGMQLHTETPHGKKETISCRYLFNCTYSNLNQLGGDFPGLHTSLKQEITEIALMEVPPLLKNIGITVMDGPFFSLMPFPPRNLHSLSHVRYTPHLYWQDKQEIAPHEKLEHYGCESRVERMVRDAARYLPVLQDAQYVDSLFEVKTILMKNEGDDGRPILLEKYQDLPGYYSVLGGKIDNIYDVLEKLDVESFS